MGIDKRALKLWMENRTDMLTTLRTLSKLGILEADDVDSMVGNLDKIALARRTEQCEPV